MAAIFILDKKCEIFLFTTLCAIQFNFENNSNVKI